MKKVTKVDRNMREVYNYYGVINSHIFLCTVFSQSSISVWSPGTSTCN